MIASKPDAKVVVVVPTIALLSQQVDQCNDNCNGTGIALSGRLPAIVASAACKDMQA